MVVVALHDIFSMVYKQTGSCIHVHIETHTHTHMLVYFPFNHQQGVFYSSRVILSRGSYFINCGLGGNKGHRVIT